jgi:ribosomal protein L37AE/L43A
MSDEYSDEYARAVLEMLIVNRGGVPEACDFCKQPFTVARYPVPEEGSAWACRECEARWAKEEARDGE